jgi:hypothetical protein
MPSASASTAARRVRRRLIALGVLVLLAFSLPVAVRAAQAASAPPVRLSLQQTREVNYMPSSASWQDMWTNWNPAQLTHDYKAIKALGANTVRVIVPAPAFGYPSPSPVMAGRLARVLSLASAQGLHVQLTLFDEFGLYLQIPSSIQFVQRLLSRYANDPEIAFVELQNEIWPSNHAAMTWAAALIPALKSVVGSVPVTISTPGSLGPAGLEALKHDLVRSPPDFYDFHFYGSIGDAYATIAWAKAVAAPSKIFIGEAGIDTAGPGTAILASQQAEFFDSVDGATSALGLPPAAPWTMYDLTQRGAPPGTTADELDWGLFRTDGTPKPAASLEGSFFKTDHVPLILNPSFVTSYEGIPTGWLPVNRSHGRLTLDPATGPGGVPSVQISAASGPQDAQPAWSTTANLGALTPGQQVLATAWAEGSGATGQTTISIAWFNRNDAYISNATSALLPPGRSVWTRLRVRSAAPAGAAYAVVYLQSWENPGTAKFRLVALSRA